MNWKKWIVAVSLIVACAIAIIWGLNIRNHKISLAEVYHSRDDECEYSGYMYEAQTLENQYLFSRDCFSENEVKTYIKELEKEIAYVQKKMNCVSFFEPVRLKVFVLPDYQTLETIDKQNVLIISKDDLVSGEYKLPLFLNVCNLYANSKTYGAFAFVYQIPYDNEKIAQYIYDEKNREVLDLFYARTYDVCENEENAEIFRQILASLANHLIEKEGLEAYLAQDITIEKLNEWLAQFSIVLEENEEFSNLNQIQFLRDGKYQLHMVNNQAIYLITDYAKNFENLAKMKEFILGEIESREKVRKYLEEQHIENALTKNGFSITYEIDKQDNNPSLTKADKKNNCAFIKLHAIKLDTLIHEMTHAISGYEGLEKKWLEEGIATYFGENFFLPSTIKENLYQDFISNTSSLNKKWQNYYMERKNMPSNSDELDLSLYYAYPMYDYLTNNMQSDMRALSQKLYQMYHLKDDKMEGMELSYYEAMSFAEYLIEQYTLQEVWDYLTLDKSLQDSFGENYKQLKVGWQRSVLSR